MAKTLSSFCNGLSRVIECGEVIYFAGDDRSDSIALRVRLVSGQFRTIVIEHPGTVRITT